MYTIQKPLNFYNDWKDIIKNILENKGYSFTENDKDKIPELYFTYLKKTIPVMPRQIKKSDIFVCPNELINGLNDLENKIKTGQDVNPHLSKKAKNLNESDDMLYHWNIYHFHLGTTMENNGYIKRTGKLLFAFCDNKTFYFLNIMNHDAWTKQEMIKTACRNWPEIIPTYMKLAKAKEGEDGIIGLECNLSDSDVQKLRKAGINVLTDVGIDIIFPIGGGVNAKGDSFEVMDDIINVERFFHDIEREIKTDIKKFLLSKAVCGLQNINLCFKLVKENGKYWLKELNNNKLICQINCRFLQ